MKWDRKDLLSIEQFDREDFDLVHRLAQELEPYSGIFEPPRLYFTGHPLDLCEGRILVTAFFEDSTRTRGSFQTAMLRLGGQVSPFSFVGSSKGKGESDIDTLRMLATYADILAVRHPTDGSVPAFASTLDKPVANGGDGKNQHPTQTILDLYTIWKCLESIDGQKVMFLGDLTYGRTVHSLWDALKQYNGISVVGVCPVGLEMPSHYVAGANNYRQIALDDMAGIKEVIGDERPNVLYATRVQKERFQGDASKFLYTITPETMQVFPKDSILMHPLPRPQKGEEYQDGRDILLSPATWDIDPEVDKDTRAVYFKQAAYGVPTRMAEMALMLAQYDDAVNKNVWEFMGKCNLDPAAFHLRRWKS